MYMQVVFLVGLDGLELVMCCEVCHWTWLEWGCDVQHDSTCSHRPFHVRAMSSHVMMGGDMCSIGCEGARGGGGPEVPLARNEVDVACL